LPFSAQARDGLQEQSVMAWGDVVEEREMPMNRAHAAALDDRIA
jgi:hypothetical protein